MAFPIKTPLFAFLVLVFGCFENPAVLAQTAGNAPTPESTQNVSVTFRVSTKGQSFGPTPVWLEGSFNNWTAEAMDNIGDGVWEKTKNLPPGQIFYKFGHSSNYESVPSECGVAPDYNRTATIGTTPVQLPLVCFSRCNESCIPKRLVRFTVNMSGQAVSPEGVFVAGTFNFWNTSGYKLIDRGNGVYSRDFYIPSSQQQYKFVNGSSYEQVPSSCGTGANLNRSISTVGLDEDLPMVCFGDCDASCETTVLVTTKVDITELLNVVGEVRLERDGQPSVPMVPIGNNVFQVSVPVPKNSIFKYRFRKGSVSEGVPDQCRAGVFDNYRSRSVGTENVVLPVVCHGRCTDGCATPTNPVTFRVSMKGREVAPEGVKLAASFNGFSTSLLPMKYVGNAIYEAVVPLANNTYTYKFVNGTEFESGLTACGVGGTLDRQVVVNGAAQVLPLVCFGQCSNTCDPTTYTKVTFRLSTNQFPLNLALGPRLAGSFNGFSVEDKPMDRVVGNLYETDVLLPAGQTVTYKFTYGSQFETGLSTQPCGVNDGNGNFNRSLVVPATDTRLPTVCYGFCTSVCSPTRAITFRVNMSGQTVSPDGVKLAGSFNGFSTTANPMTPVGNNVYETTVQLAQDIYTYKFVNGNTFESGLSDCGVGNTRDRQVTVFNNGFSINTVCFGRCDNSCASTATTYPVVFRVNMTGQTVSPQGVKLAGSFNGFSTTATPMASVGNNVYEATVQLQNGNYTYKFVNGATFEEGLTACGVGSTLDRQIAVNNAGATPTTVCFGRCDLSCVPTFGITFRVNMTGQTVSAQGMKLAGSFNGFSTTATPMTAVGNNVYEATVILQSGTYTYKFVNGSTFEEGLTACGVGGTFDRQVVVGNAAQTLPTVCFGRCDNNCPSSTATFPVTFRVNMTNNLISPSGIKLAGSFNNFSLVANPMTDVGNNIFETTLQLPAGTHTYRFVNGLSIEPAMPLCGVEPNWDRDVVVSNAPQTLPTVCFARCDNNCPQRYPVVFRVNMNNVFVSGSGIKLAGSFNNFSTTDQPMVLVGVNLYETTVLLPAGTYTYRFVNGITLESGLTTCGVAPNFDRQVVVGNAPLTLPTACFGRCDQACLSGSATQSVTFRVNMTGQSVSPDGMKLAGSFNGFSTTANPMTAVGNNVYETTIQLEAATYTYKFVNGSTFETGLTACGVGATLDRQITVAGSALEIPSTCFGQCDLSCTTVSVTAGLPSGSFRLFPNPVRDQLRVQGLVPGAPVWVSNTMGQILKTEIPSREEIRVSCRDLPAGLYRLHQGNHHATFLVLP